MKNKFRWISLFLVATLAPLTFAAVKFEISDRAKVYLGSPDKVVSPCVIEIQKVFDKLPSYQEALQEKEGSAKRVHGMKKASDDFKEYVGKVCKDKKYEFVAEKGVLTATDSSTKKSVALPDITDEVIRLISEK